MNKFIFGGVLLAVSAFVVGASAMAQNGNSNQPDIGTGVPIQQRAQQQLQDGSGAGAQTQAGNQGETAQVQNREQEALQVVEQRGSVVVEAVQKMLQIGDRNGVIGQQIKTIAQSQNQNQVKLEASLKKVQDRSGFAKFFIGPNYGEINLAKKVLEQNREQNRQLEQLRTQLSNQEDAQSLIQQIQTMEQSNLQIEDSLGSSLKGFGLLGWLFKWLAK